MTTVRDGQVNLLGLTNPGVIVDIVPPTPFVGGVPTNIEALVGVGSWGPVNTVAAFSDPDSCPYGPPQVRFADIATHVAAGCQMGGAIAFRGVRVTDGMDAAASATVQAAAGTLTARYTGTRGNQIGVTFQPTAAPGAYAAVVSFPGRAAERFEGIHQGVQSLTVTPGTGYTSVPAIAMTAPQKAGGVQATASASLKVVTAAVAAGGSGYAVGNTITLSNGVVLTVASVTSGAVAMATITIAGSLATGATPANPVAQVSTNASGTGATFNLTWGLGPATLVSGSGYTAGPTLTMIGGGGTGGSYVPVASFWAALAYAINNGTPQRGRSNYVVFTPGTSTAAPTLNTPVVLSGGTDGATGVGTAQLVGIDTVPRTGMYALRGSGMDTFALCDCTDTAPWSAMAALGISENAYPLVATPSGDTIANAVATRINSGIDDGWLKIIVGDWPTFYDQVNGSRLVSPTAIAQGLFGNLSPEQSPINKPLLAVTATQTSQTGVLTSDAEESVAQTGGVDFIGRSAALGQTFFSFMTGRNASSNTAGNGDEYVRLTNFIAKSLQGAAARSIVGKLQSIRADDPTRIRAKAILDSFFQDMKNPSFGSDGYGMIDEFAVVCDLTNNTPTSIARGYLFAFCAVRYLNVVRYFVIKLAGGGNVQVTSQRTAPTFASVLAAQAA